MEINSGSSTLPIPDDTRLLGQRPSNEGGAPVPFSVSELTDKIMGGGGTTFVREGLTATKTLRAVPVTAGEAVHPYVEGSPTFAHTIDGWSGIPARFAKEADHFHYKARVANAAGPGAGTAGERAQLMYSARTAGDSTLNLHGYASEIPTTSLASEHSIDTTGTTVSGAPSYIGTIRFRHTVNHGLTLNQRVIFRVTSAVAGIQASFFYGLVTQAPTLVSGLYETLVQVTGLDPNHWTGPGANVSDKNGDWVLMTLNSGEINSANKTSMARDTGGPADQLLVTWATAHGLSYGQNVVVWADGAITGLTGIWAGFHSGHVAEVVSTTQVKIRVRNIRVPTSRSFGGAVSSATATWAVFAGTLDPHHEVIQSGNAITAWRDSSGRTRRVAVGDTDVTTDDEWAIGTGGPGNELRGRMGDMRLGRHSMRTMSGSRDPRRGVRSIRDGTTTNCMAITAGFGSMGTLIGAGEFSFVFDAMLDFSEGAIGGITDTACFFVLRLRPSGDIVMETWDGTTITATLFGVNLLHLQGTRGVIALQRGTAGISVSLNGAEIYRGTPASWDRTISTAAVLRVGGAFVAGNRYNSTIYAAWMFAHALTQPDLDFITIHGRPPNALQWAPSSLVYVSDFSAGIDSWSGTECSLSGNIDSINSQDNNLRAIISSNSGAHVFFKTSILTRGKRFRISLDALRPAANELTTGVLVQHFNQLTTTQIIQLTADYWTAIPTDLEDQSVTGNNTGISISFINGSSQQVFTGNGTDTLYIRNVKVQRLGAFIALDFSSGAGLQAPDLSGNGFHATLTGPFEHVVPKRNFQVFQRVAASGNNPAVPIPVNARILSLTASSAGSVTLSVGNVGNGTQIVNAQALTSGIQDVALAGRFSSTGNLVVNLSSAVAVDLTFDCVMTGA